MFTLPNRKGRREEEVDPRRWRGLGNTVGWSGVWRGLGVGWQKKEEGKSREVVEEDNDNENGRGTVEQGGRQDAYAEGWERGRGEGV